MKVSVERYKNLAALSSSAAMLVRTAAESAVKERGLFTLVLAGGKTPRLLYGLLAAPPSMPWHSIHLFWSDERFVPAADPARNFQMAHEALISKVALPPANIHSVPADAGSPHAAAVAYETSMKDFFKKTRSADVGKGLFPVFDMILLGMGSDGHTASLFPHDAAVQEQKKWVTAVSGSQAMPPVPRVTITLPVINSSRCVVFLISGEEKRDVANASISNTNAARKIYPAALVQPEGELHWLIDEQST
jgi:6-phosphogluconolactonase